LFKTGLLPGRPILVSNGVGTAGHKTETNALSPASFSVANVRAMGLFGLSVLAVGVGIVTGLGAVGFRALIALISQCDVPRHLFLHL